MEKMKLLAVCGKRGSEHDLKRTMRCHVTDVVFAIPMHTFLWLLCVWGLFIILNRKLAEKG